MIKAYSEALALRSKFPPAPTPPASPALNCTKANAAFEPPAVGRSANSFGRRGDGRRPKANSPLSCARSKRRRQTRAPENSSSMLSYSINSQTRRAGASLNHSFIARKPISTHFPKSHLSTGVWQTPYFQYCPHIKKSFCQYKEESSAAQLCLGNIEYKQSRRFFILIVACSNFLDLISV